MPDPSSFALSGSCLVGPDFEFRERAIIEIEDGHIVRLADSDRPGPDARPDMRRFPECVILPALVNPHVHLRDAVAAEAATGLPLDAAVIGPESVRARHIAAACRSERVSAMRAALEDMGRLGIGLVGDFCDGGPAGVEEVREAAAGLNMEVVVFGRLFKSIQGLQQPVERLDGPQRTELAAVLDLADGFSTATVNDYGDAAWREIAAEVRRRGKLLAVHAAEAAAHTAASLRMTGRTDVERALAIGFDHLVHLTSASSEILAPVLRGHTPVIVCPRSNALTGAGWPPLDTLLRAGVPVALGTDNVMLNSGNLWRELEFASKCARTIRRDPAAVDLRALLRAASLNGAKALGRDRTTGCIEAGKRADLVVVRFDRSPLRFTTDRLSALVHRIEPDNVVGRFFAGRWLPNAPA